MKRFIPSQHLFLKNQNEKKKLINNHEMWAYLLRTLFCFATDRHHQKVFLLYPCIICWTWKKVWCVDIFLHKMVFSDEFASWAKLELCLI